MENKRANQELLREMVKISNNSQITMSAATMLTNKLDNSELIEVLNWLRLASRQQSNKINSDKRRFY